MTNHSIKDESLDEIVDRINRWVRNPSSEPELNSWYNHSCPENNHPFSNYSSDDDAHDRCYSLYQKANELEQRGKEIEAFIIYIKILSEYSPKGTLYFESPIYLAEQYGFYKMAISICNKAIDSINNKDFNADVHDFVQTKERLFRKLKLFMPNIHESRLNYFKNILLSKTDLNKTRLYSILESEGWSQMEINHVVNYALTSGEIKVEKIGRAYKYRVLR